MILMVFGLWPLGRERSWTKFYFRPFCCLPLEAATSEVKTSKQTLPFRLPQSCLLLLIYFGNIHSISMTLDIKFKFMNIAFPIQPALLLWTNIGIDERRFYYVCQTTFPTHIYSYNVKRSYSYVIHSSNLQPTPTPTATATAYSYPVLIT